MPQTLAMTCFVSGFPESASPPDRKRIRSTRGCFDSGYLSRRLWMMKTMLIWRQTIPHSIPHSVTLPKPGQGFQYSCISSIAMVCIRRRLVLEDTSTTVPCPGGPWLDRGWDKAKTATVCNVTSQVLAAIGPIYQYQGLRNSCI